MEASKESAEADTAVHGGASSSSTSGGGEDSGQNVPRDFDAVRSEDDSTPLGDDEEVETGPTVIVGEDGQEYMLLGGTAVALDFHFLSALRVMFMCRLDVEC